MIQFDLFGNEVKVNAKPINKEKRNWENSFQRRSDNRALNDGTTSYGVCGYSSICDYCEDNTHGRPCVRALNQMCKEKGIAIDYSKRNFEEIWHL